MATYGSVAGAAAFVGHLTNAAGTFDNLGPPTGTAPTLDQVETFLDQVSAQLTGWLAAAGYAVPVVQSDAKSALDGYANVGAAGLAELSQRVAGTSDDENRRENRLLAEFRRAEDWIKSGALAGLGVGRLVVGPAARQAASGALTTGTAADTARAGRPPEWK